MTTVRSIVLTHQLVDLWHIQSSSSFLDIKPSQCVAVGGTCVWLNNNKMWPFDEIAKLDFNAEDYWQAKD